jgi:MMP 1-O-methyltransferase
VGRIDDVIEVARRTRGFMPDDEGAALAAAARRAGTAFASEAGLALPGRAGLALPGRAGLDGPATFVEIGAWCGKSTLYLGGAAEVSGAVLFSIDHHRGSEENQAGWEHHDTDLVDPDDGRLDTLPHWRRAVAAAGLEAAVVGIVGDSPTVAAHWRTPVAFCFIDGGHGDQPAWADYRGWSPHVAVGGWLAIHDVFRDPADGGRPPYELWCAALASGEWVEDGECGSLRVLRRVAPPVTPA